MRVKRTFEIRVPFFSGFYCSIWNNEDMVDDEIDFNTMELDFDSYSKDIAQVFTSEIESLFQYTFNGVESLEFKELFSPREYNYSTDKIYANLNVDYDVFWNHFLSLINKHKKEVEAAIKDEWSFRSGFISFLSADLDTWLSDIDNKGELGWLLGVLYKLETREEDNEIEYNIYDKVVSNGYDISLYYE